MELTTNQRKRNNFISNYILVGYIQLNIHAVNK